ncbi:hypothetical protein NKI96_24365 [Mesorhizobium sp. M0292]|uniref:hypothetical protein n=1 Tax=Mesorhizobium sp. M0292 TaxID=2956929 RepID=UPI0033362593
MSSDGPTLEDLARLVGDMCNGAVVAYHFAATDKGRVRALERVLDFSYDSLVENRHLNQSHSEDALTVNVVEQLKGFLINASHDTQNGGHCDILVRGKGRFLWVAEAKIHNGYSWLEKGFRQLCTYLTGSENQDHGEIIIYLRQQKANVVLHDWMRRLTGIRPDLSVDDQVENSLWFRSSHSSEGTGRNLFIRHRIIPLFWHSS